MLELAILPGTDLTDYVLQLLQKNGIETVQDFMASDVDSVCKATNLTRTSFVNIKRELLNKYGPKHNRMSQLYKQIVRAPLPTYRSGVPNLDLILSDDIFCGGCLLEVCGFAAIGKTQLILTVVLNFATHYAEVLYIETRVKCIGSRIYQMLKSRNASKCEMGQILQRIKIERTLSAQGIINILSELLQQLEGGTVSAASNIKLVVIDSLPAVWLHILGQEEKHKGNYLLTRLANLMRKLAAKHFLVFVFVNLLVKVEQKPALGRDFQIENEESSQDDDIDDDDVTSQHSESDTNIRIRPALGTYWNSVPTIRLSMERCSESTNIQFDDESDIRLIKVLKACYSKSGENALVRITNAGVE